MWYRIFLIVGVLSTTHVGLGQQDAQFTQYMDNVLYVNPAYAGSQDMLNAQIFSRNQWIGFNGAPKTVSAGVHSPLGVDNMGGGISVLYDQIGPIDRSSVYGDLSYTLKFKKSKGRLAMGLKFGMNLMNARTNELLTTVNNDPQFMTNAGGIISPNFGFGLY